MPIAKATWFSVGLSALMFLSTSANGQTNTWRGLTPLKSTIADVEKVLGLPTESKFKYAYEYKLGAEYVTVNYSEKRCDSGWDVAHDTVLDFKVSSMSNSGKTFEEMGLDKEKYFVSVDDAFYGTWTDPVDGKAYYFGNIDQQLMDIHFIPRRSDNLLRCNGFPPYRPEGLHFTMEKHGLYDPRAPRESLYETVAWLQSATFELKQMRETHRGYLVAYYDNRLSLLDYRARLNTLKTYGFDWFKIPRTDLIFIEGGMRERSEIDFYLLPKKWAPPAPNPTLPSPQFMKKNPSLRKKRVRA